MKKKELLTVEGYELPILIEQEDDVFLAKCTNWEACYAQGYTVENVMFEITQVAIMLIELSREQGEKIPLKRIQKVYNPAHVGSPPASL